MDAATHDPGTTRHSGDRPRILVELQPCFDGFAGIPQETRLLYAMLAGTPAVEVGGWVNTYLGSRRPFTVSRPASKARPKKAAAAASRARFQQARALVAVDWLVSEGKTSRSASARLEKGGLRQWWAEFRYLAGWRDPGELLPIDSREFADLLWVHLFEKSLPPDAMAKVLGTPFFVSSVGRKVAEHFARWKGREQPIKTGGWDFFLCQKGCAYRLPSGTRPVVRYHDAIPVFLPHTIVDQRSHLKSHYHALRASVRSGAHFVCVSEPVRQDLLRLAPEAAEEVSIIPDIVSSEYWPADASGPMIAEIAGLRECSLSAPTDSAGAANRAVALQAISEGCRYLLAVGTLEPRKNIALLLRAFEAALRQEPATKLILVANPGWRFKDELQAIGKLVRLGRVIHLWRVPTEELRVLYSNAQAVVCASRSEGFDLAGEEAMLCGATVLASDIPVHRWVYGDHATYFNPYDREALARCLIETLATRRDLDRVREVREAGRRHVRQYTDAAVQPQWERLFERLMTQRGNATQPARSQSAPGTIGPGGTLAPATMAAGRGGPDE